MNEIITLDQRFERHCRGPALSVPLPTGSPSRIRFGRTRIPTAQCKPNTAGFGLQRDELAAVADAASGGERDSKTVGGSVIPAPPPIVERPLPHAEDVPAKPSFSDEGPGGTVLPSIQGITTPSTSAGTGRIDGGATTGPGGGPLGSGHSPAGQRAAASVARFRPGSVRSPTPPRSDSLLPGGALPSPLTTTPGTASAAPARSSDSTPSPLKGPAEAAPSPGATPDAAQHRLPPNRRLRQQRRIPAECSSSQQRLLPPRRPLLPQSRTRPQVQ